MPLCPGELARAWGEGQGWEKGDRERAQTPEAAGQLPRNGALSIPLASVLRSGTKQGQDVSLWMVEHWNRLPRGAGESPSPDILKTHLDTIPCNPAVGDTVF